MTKSRLPLGLTIGLALGLSLLLTPLGFETRPLNTVSLLGNMGLDAYLAGAILSVAALALIVTEKRKWLASIFGIIGQFLFLPIILLDLTGNFSSLPPPPAIPPTEIATIIAAFSAIYFGFEAYRRPSPISVSTTRYQ